MGIIAWIALGMAVGLLANMPFPAKDHGRLFSSAWLAALAEAAVPLLACGLLARQSSRAGGFTRRWDIQEGSP